MLKCILQTFIVAWLFTLFILVFKSWTMLIGFVSLFIDFLIVRYFLFWGVSLAFEKSLKFWATSLLKSIFSIWKHQKFQTIRNFVSTHWLQLKKNLPSWLSYTDIPLYVLLYILFCLIYWSFLYQYDLCRELLNKIVTPNSKNTFSVWYYLNHILYFIYNGLIVGINAIILAISRFDSYTLPIYHLIEFVRVCVINVILVAPAPIYIVIEIIEWSIRINMDISSYIEWYWSNQITLEQLKLLLEQKWIKITKISHTPPLTIDYIVSLINKYTHTSFIKPKYWASTTGYRLHFLHYICDILGIFVKVGVHTLQFLLNVGGRVYIPTPKQNDYLLYYWIDSETILSSFICQWFPVYWQLILSKISYIFIDVNDLLTRASVSRHINILYNPFDGVEEPFEWITFADKWNSFCKICNYYPRSHTMFTHNSMNLSSTFTRINDLTHNTRSLFKN